MSLSDIVNINIVASAAGVAKSNFGIPLIAVFHTVGVGGPRVRTYSSLPAVKADHAETSLPYLIAQVVFSQKKRVRQVKIGRRATAWTQLVHLIPKATTEGYQYVFEIDGMEVTYTVGSSETVATVCDGIVAAINTVNPAVTATDGTTHVICTSDVAGVFHTYKRSDLQHDSLWFKDQTTDASAIATDLSAFETEDSNWYGLYVDIQSELVLGAASAWVEARDKEMYANTHDTEVGDSGTTTDIASDLKGLAVVRTHLAYHPDIGDHLMAGLMGYLYTLNPGSYTAAFKTVTGSRVYKVSDTFKTGLESKGTSHYQVVKGRSIVFPALSLGNSNIFWDFVRGRDWLAARMGERIFGILVVNDKLDYENASSELFRSEINAQLEEGADKKFLTRDVPFVINVPDAQDQDSSDRSNRHFPDIEWTAQASGAIHTIDINGSITF